MSVATGPPVKSKVGLRVSVLGIPRSLRTSSTMPSALTVEELPNKSPTIGLRETLVIPRLIEEGAPRS
jgi:hypothetical protein